MRKIVVPITAATEATAIAVDPNYKKLRLARELGAMETINEAFMMLEQSKVIGRVIIIP